MGSTKAEEYARESKKMNLAKEVIAAIARIDVTSGASTVREENCTDRR